MRIDIDTKTGNPSIPVDQLMLFFDNKIRGLCGTLKDMRENGIVDGTTFLTAMLYQTRIIRNQLAELSDTAVETADLYTYKPEESPHGVEA